MAFPAETYHGPFTTVPETVVTLPPQEFVPQAIMILQAERRLFQPPVELAETKSGIDVKVDLSAMDAFNRDSKQYEDECFQVVVDSLGPNQVALGPHFIDAAFMPVTSRANPDKEEFKRTRISIPDAFVFDLEDLDPSGIPLYRPRLVLAGLVEARTGKRLGAQGKLTGFKNFLEVMRKNPEDFELAIQSILRGRGFGKRPFQLITPPDEQLSVDFHYPRVPDDPIDSQRQEFTLNNPFMIYYHYLPIPEREKAA